ncbi:MAG: glycerol-3-phosphate 1-O-acyltransferase PlsY [Gammaproteobacteria bacterium]|nr:glycerol-3-phosphate 1-O-acyltransferase PlsY [Gammaproteobacteria bacterium]
MVQTIVLVGLAYLLGSVASGVIVCRLMGLPDPRTQGSGNLGTTNVLRVFGKKLAALTLAGDVLKGLLPLLVGRALHVSDLVLALMGLAALLGHLYPVFFGFKGGKGVATLIGVFFGMAWPLGSAFVLTWLLMAAAFHYSSLAALVAAALAPIYTALLVPTPSFLIVNCMMAAVLIWRHRANVRRLLNGTEDKISLNKP